MPQSRIDKVSPGTKCKIVVDTRAKSDIGTGVSILVRGTEVIVKTINQSSVSVIVPSMRGHLPGTTTPDPTSTGGIRRVPLSTKVMIIEK